MINPHAILLKRSNFPEIVHWTRTSYENLKEILVDALNKGEVLYIVFNLDTEGKPNWKTVTEDSLADEYGLGLHMPSRFNNHFSKL